MAISDRDWARAVELLSDADEVALACHVDPDGDALGSLLALARWLRSRGARVTASYGWGRAAHGGGVVVPPQYTFLPGIEELVPPAAFPASPELFVGLDTGTPGRLGSLRPAAEAAGASILIDHHASGEAFGDVRLVDPGAAATAVLVDELITRMGGRLDAETATCLYVGLVTDTGRFQHPSTTPEVFRLAARLISYGIDHPEINRRVWETRSFGYLKVLGRAMERAELVPEAGLAWTAVYERDLEAVGVTRAETEGLIDVLRAVEAAECACVCKERATDPPAPPEWAVSLRSKGAVDVGRLAARLGGGGHRFAAGYTATGGLAGVIDELVDALVWDVQGTSASGVGR